MEFTERMRRIWGFSREIDGDRVDVMHRHCNDQGQVTHYYTSPYRNAEGRWYASPANWTKTRYLEGCSSECVTEHSVLSIGWNNLLVNGQPRKPISLPNGVFPIFDQRDVKDGRKRYASGYVLGRPG